MDLLEQGARTLQTARHEHMSRDMVYVRGEERITISVTRGRSSREVLEEDVIRLDTEAQEMILRAEDLVLGGSPTTPTTGDRIEDDHDGTLHIYEVRPPSQSEPAWRWTDAHKLDLRVFVKHIGQEASP
jgi:hypothetical protein